MIRIRTWAAGNPLPNMDVATASRTVALQEARWRGETYGFDNVSVLFPGERDFKGAELRELLERSSA